MTLSTDLSPNHTDFLPNSSEQYRHYGKSLRVEQARARLARAIGRTLRVRGIDRALRLLYPPDRRARDYTEAVTRLRDGSLFEVDTRSFIEWMLYLYGEYEPHVRDVIKACLRPGDMAIDVGANIGVHTVAMARAVGETGLVLAVEPLPRIVDRLERNLELNNLSRQVRVVIKAASDHPGATVFYPPSETATNQAQGSLFALKHLDPKPIDIDLATLDNLVEENGLDRVRLVKIDVEGGEAEVIGGARRLIDEQRPYVLFEYNAGHYAEIGRDWGEVSSLAGVWTSYTFFAVRRHGIEWLPAAPHDFGCMILGKPEGAD